MRNLLKNLLLFILILGWVGNSYSIVPSYYGARSLSLGKGGMAFNYDLNAIFINPSLLNYLSYSLSGYQYQNSFQDYKSFYEDLEEVLNYNLSEYEMLDSTDKRLIHSKLYDLFNSKTGMHGFISNIPGFVTRNYGLAFSVINTAVINPANSIDANNLILSKNPDDITNDEISDLQMNFLGLRYKQFTIAYAQKITRTINIGIGLHYLNGKITEYNTSIVDNTFSREKDIKDYLKLAWEKADEKFNKIISDISFSWDVNQFFKLGLIIKNIGNPKINSTTREITLKQRVIAGLSFRPNLKWGIYLDLDVNKTDMFFNGNQMQPLSFGIERGFANNHFYLRAGFMSDLRDKHFFGSKSNILYGFGLGFNMNRFIVDVAMGADSSGKIKSLAISGFILLK
jgi:hypothetical protein